MHDEREGVDFTRLLTGERSERPFWAYRLSKVREAILGNESEFVAAVKLHGAVKVAIFLSEQGFPVSASTIRRIRREVEGSEVDIGKSAELSKGKAHPDGQSSERGSAGCGDIAERERQHGKGCSSDSDGSVNDDHDSDGSGSSVRIIGSRKVGRDMKVSSQSGRGPKELGEEIFKSIMEDSFRREE